jgi:CubicO group peptidase (beta-lactamase class C family)
MQQLVLDVAKEPFPKLLHDSVLAPIGMTHSTYQQPLPAEMRAHAATPYHADGKPIEGGAHTYPEMAAAGLWTTPTDLARYILENQHSLAGKGNHVLSVEMTKEMMKPGLGKWGLGLEIGGSEDNPYFSHGGVNEGFESLFAAYEHGGEGAVIMTNAEGGSRLAEEIMASIAKVYGWPDFKATIRTTVPVDPATLAQYVGSYEVAANFSIEVTLEKDHLMLAPPGQDKVQLYPESPTEFFLTVANVEFEFFKDDKGAVSYVVLHQNGHDSKAMKK